MYSVVMVPVDGSAFSREAVFQGLRIARKSEAQLRLVRVASVPVVFAGPEMVQLENTAWKLERASILKQLYELAKECRMIGGIDVTVSVEDGPIADALAAHARNHKVDLIVMATHARRGIARMWHGSVADKLIRETGIPVLLVRPPSLSTEMSSGPCFKKILITLDGSQLAERSLKPALALAEAEGAEVTLLRIVAEEKNIPVGELQSSLGAARAEDVRDAQWYLASIRILLSQRPLKVRSKILIASDPASAILDYAESHEIDLIALATHGRGGLARAMIGSVADHLITGGLISVLTVHPAEKPHDQAVPESRPMFELTTA